MSQFNQAEEFNRMYEESKKNGFNTIYTRVNNSQYNKNKERRSTIKTVTGIVTTCILGYYIYKNILKPAAGVVNTFFNMFDEQQNNSVNRADNRVFDGNCRPLSKVEELKYRHNCTILAPDQYEIRDAD